MSSDLFETFSPLLSGELGNTFPCRRFFIIPRQVWVFHEWLVFFHFCRRKIAEDSWYILYYILDAYMLSVMTVRIHRDGLYTIGIFGYLKSYGKGSVFRYISLDFRFLFAIFAKIKGMNKLCGVLISFLRIC